MCKDSNLKIYAQKSKVMAFKGNFVAHLKLEINRILQQVSWFNYLGKEVCIFANHVVTIKLNEFKISVIQYKEI